MNEKTTDILDELGGLHVEKEYIGRNVIFYSDFYVLPLFRFKGFTRQFN
jgi:hypothetical protein